MSKLNEEEEEGKTEIDWESEYEEAKKNKKRLGNIPKKELLNILFRKNENVKKMKEAPEVEAIYKYCLNESDRRKCLKILKDIREGRMKIEERNNYSAGIFFNEDDKRVNDPLLTAAKKAIEANDCPCLMTLSRGCFLPNSSSIVIERRSYTLFGYSCKLFSDECALFLLQAGGGIEQKLAHGATPLMVALGSGNEAIGMYLIERGANIRAKDKMGGNPLRWAAHGDCVEIFKYLIDKGEDIYVIDDAGGTLLHWAAQGSFEITKLLIEIGFDIEARDGNGGTPLYYTALMNTTEIAKLLIEKGANVEAKDYDGKTSLYYAALMNTVEIAKLLIEKGVDIKSKDNDGRTPLHFAAQASAEITKLLIENGFDTGARDNDGRTPLHCAALMNNVEAAKLLIEKGVNVESKDNTGRTPLQTALFHNSWEIATLLIPSQIKSKNDIEMILRVIYHSKKAKLAEHR